MNFSKEATVHETLGKTKDLFKTNPYQSYPVREIYNYEQLKAIFYDMGKDYTFGVAQIRKFLKDADLNKNGFMDPEEIRIMLGKLGLHLVFLEMINKNKGRSKYEINIEKYGHK